MNRIAINTIVRATRAKPTIRSAPPCRWVSMINDLFKLELFLFLEFNTNCW